MGWFSSRFYRVKAWFIFKIGHIRRLHFFPYFTLYGYDTHKINMKEARNAVAVARPGDIGIHLDEGFVSNLAIPGAFKHAWVHVENNDCIEAVAEGVLRRDAMIPAYSDCAMILRPIGVNKAEIDEAMFRVKAVVGCEYNADFDFPFEELDTEYKKYTQHLTNGFHKAFTCTELAAFTWYHRRDKLKIFRTMHFGREAIIADEFLKMNFGIIWMSSSVTLDWAKKAGLHEEGCKKIQDFLNGVRDFNEYGNPIPR